MGLRTLTPTSASTFLAAIALLTGCTGSPAVPLATPTDAPVITALTAVQSGAGMLHAPIGLYDLVLDPATLSAATTSLTSRNAAANDDLYLLPIDRFLRADSLTVARVRGTADTIEVTLRFTHPFPAPTDPSGTASAGNRADLGIVGQLICLQDVPTATGRTFFGDVVIDTDVIANPDALIDPSPLITLTGAIATAFPAYSLVFDGGPDGSRVGISHGGNKRGNFGTDGWTRAELGPNNTGWTGYGALHQGQATERTIALNKSALSTDPYKLQIGVLAKYNDPRGGATGSEKRGNRLPPATPDATKFAYRMPHGALDVEQMIFGGADTTLIANTISSAGLEMYVVDWDTHAVPTTETDHANDPDVTHVAIGENGPPSLSVDLPGIITSPVDMIFGGAGETGEPGDELIFNALITNTTVSGQTPGTYRGLVRATDVETLLDPPLLIGLTADLTPIPAAEVPQAITYQHITVEVEASPPPTGSWVQLTGVAGGYTYANGIVVDPATGNSWTLGAFNTTMDFDPGAGTETRTNQGGNDAYCWALDPAGNFRWVETLGTTSSDAYFRGALGPNNSIQVIGNGGNPSFATCHVLDRDTGANIRTLNFGSGNIGARGIGVNPAGQTIIMGSFRLTQDFDPGPGVFNVQSGTTGIGDDTYLLWLNPDGTFNRVLTLGQTSSNTVGIGLALDSTGGPHVTGYFEYSSGDLDPGPAVYTVPGMDEEDAFTVALDADGDFLWAVSWPGFFWQVGQSIAIDGNSNTISSGYFVDYIDMDPGPAEAFAGASGTDSYIISLDDTGSFNWGYTFGNFLNDYAYDMTVLPDDDIAVTGTYGGNVDFGGGPVPWLGGNDCFLLRLNNNGTFDRVAVWGSTGTEFAFGVAGDSSGAPRVAGWLTTGGVDFDPGVGVQSRSAIGTGDVYVLKLEPDWSWQ